MKKTMLDAQPRRCYPLQPRREAMLREISGAPGASDAADPKYQAVERILLHGVGRDGPVAGRGLHRLQPVLRLGLLGGRAPLAAAAGGDRSRSTPAAAAPVFSAPGSSRAWTATSSRRTCERRRFGCVDRHRRRLRGAEPAAARHAHQPRPALEPDPAGAAEGAHPAHRPDPRRGVVYNMRYRGSVEDRVHQLLSQRLQAIRDLFGQIPDTLEDVWVPTALRDEQRALEIIDAGADRHPFELRYDRVEPVDWESCAEVLDSQAQLDVLMQPWTQRA